MQSKNGYFELEFEKFDDGFNMELVITDKYRSLEFRKMSDGDLIDISIEKFELILEGILSREVIHAHWKALYSCALCRVYINSGCEGCPIKNKTGFTSCLKTPFDRFTNYFLESSDVEAEIDFLKELRKDF